MLRWHPVHVYWGIDAVAHACYHQKYLACKYKTEIIEDQNHTPPSSSIGPPLMISPACVFLVTHAFMSTYNITNWPVRGSTRYSLFIINKWPIIKFIAGMPPGSGGCGGGLAPRMAFDEKLMRARAFVRKGPAVIYWLRDYYSYMLHSTPPHARRQYKIYNGCRNILFFNLMGWRRRVWANV